MWRGAAGGAAFVFVVLGGFTSVLGGILAMRWTSSLPSLRDMRPWSDIDDDDAQDVDIEGRVLARRFGNVFFTQEAALGCHRLRHRGRRACDVGSGFKLVVCVVTGPYACVSSNLPSRVDSVFNGS